MRLLEPFSPLPRPMIRSPAGEIGGGSIGKGDGAMHAARAFPFNCDLGSLATLFVGICAVSLLAVIGF
jgi:hypothetical protein